MREHDRRKDLVHAVRCALNFSAKGRSILVSRVLLEGILAELEGKEEDHGQA